jgi:dolichyl-phosphate-mannose-protein mannosyltransferase
VRRRDLSRTLKLPYIKEHGITSHMRSSTSALERARGAVFRALRFITWTHGGLTVVLTSALVLRVWLLRWWSAFPFGDVFNFVGIAQALARFTYPPDEKRLPFYPFLILVGHTLATGARWEHVAVAIAMVLSIVALGLLYAIGRTLRINRVPLLVSVLLLASYQPFIAYSIRGYADTTFLALLLASILAVLRARTWRGSALTGVLMALMALTRYEGVLAGVVLLAAHLLRARRSPARIASVLLAGFVILTPYAIIAQRAGRSLLPTTYVRQAAREEQGYGVDSLHEFYDRYREIWRRLGLFTLWQTPLSLTRELRENPLTFHNTVTQLVTEPRQAAPLFATVGAALLLIRRRRDVLALVLPFFAIAIPLAWWAPFIRYDAFLFPLIALTAGAGLHAALLFVRRAARSDAWGHALSGIASAAVLFAGVVWLFNFTGDARDSLRKSQLRGYGWYQALHAARPLAGTVLFDERSPIAETYFGDRAAFADDIFGENGGPAGHWDTMRARAISAAVVRTGVGHRPLLPFIFDPPPGARLEEVARFRVEQGDHDVDEGTVVRIVFSP